MKKAKKEKYVVISALPTWFEQHYSVRTFIDINEAMREYEKERECAGDNVRLARIVLDYGEEV